MKKGKYGYMDYYKKKHAIATLIYAVLIMSFALIAQLITVKAVVLILYVTAILLVLPGVKHAVAVIVVWPYHTLEKQSVKEFNEYVKNCKGHVIYDLTLASTNAIMYVPYLYMNDTKMYCLMLNITSKISLDMVHEYITKILGDAGMQFDVKMIHNVSEMNKVLEELPEQVITNEDLLAKAKKQLLIFNV